MLKYLINFLNMTYIRDDHFINSMPDTDWRVCLDHCEKIGIGTRSYELVEVK